MEKVSIIIPALNEEGGIASVLQSIKKLSLDSEVIVVDDGSTDKTGAIAKENGAIVIRHPMKNGYGSSLKDGIRKASHDIIVITDADGTYPIEKIPELVQTFEEGYDMVVGARQGGEYQGSFLKMPARFIFKLLVEFTTGSRIPDVNSGLRVFRKSVVMRFIDDLCNGFSFTTTITMVYLLTGKMVTYIPIAYNKRIGRSKVRIIQDSLRTLQYITESIARYNPLKFYLLLSIFPIIIGLIGMIRLEGLSLLLGIFTAIIIFAIGLLAYSQKR